jgi:alkylation response protein AidB-like acyl-CoA dehydrogenase
LDENKEHYILNGEKIFITNAPKAKLLGVLCRTSMTGTIENDFTVFVVETNTPGFEILQLCEFMGLRGLPNGHLKFNNVKVPKENVIGHVGQGLSQAFAGGRRSKGWMFVSLLPLVGSKYALELSKNWINERPLDRYPLIQMHVSETLSTVFAMESMFRWCFNNDFVHQTNTILEVGALKYFSSEHACRLIDKTIQMPGHK